MATIREEVVIIKFSKLVKDSDQTAPSIASEDLVSALTQVAEELAGSGVIVEIEKA